MLALQQFRGRRRRRRGNHQLRKTRRARRRQRRPRHALTESAVVASVPFERLGRGCRVSRNLSRKTRTLPATALRKHFPNCLQRGKNPPVTWSGGRASRRPAPAPSTKPNERNLSPLQLSHSSLRHEKERLNFGSDDDGWLPKAYFHASLQHAANDVSILILFGFTIHVVSYTILHKKTATETGISPNPRHLTENY